MSSAIIGFGILLFLFCLFFHVLHWRWKKPQDDIFVLFLNFVIAPLLILIFILFVIKYPFLNFSFSEVIAIYVLHLALSGVYISSYPAVQAYSPSLEILLMYSKSKSAGITREEMLKMFDKDSIVSDRVRDLVNSNWVKQEGDNYRLTFFSKVIVRCYLFYRKSLGLPAKGS